MLRTFRVEIVVKESANESRMGVLMAADSRLRAGGGVLEGLKRQSRRQEAAEYDCSWHADALVGQIELSEGVLAQGDERNAAKVGQCGVLKNHLGQTVGSVARNVVETDAVRHGQGMQVSKAANSNEKGSTGPEGAYSMLVSVLLTVSMSATCFAPSLPRPLPARL